MADRIAYRSFNYEGQKFRAGDLVPGKIADKVNQVIFQNPHEEEEFLTDGNANTELVGTKPHSEKVKSGEEDPGDDYDKMKIPQLVEIAKARDLEVPSNPKKDHLIRLLREADAS